MKYIYHHLGLGDHIICNGLVRTILNKNENYTMFVKSHNLASVKFMYRDLKNLDFIVGDDLFVRNYFSINNIPSQNIIKIGFVRLKTAKEFDDGFYQQHNIPFENRWSHFHCDRDLESELDLFKKFGVKENEYVFLHDDPDRNFKIDRNLIKNKDLKVITPINGLTDNIFDYCYLMEKSFESHFIDSSFKLVFDSLKLRNSNISYHINLVDGVIKDPATKSQSFLNFEMH